MDKLISLVVPALLSCLLGVDDDEIGDGAALMSNR